jgi:hypothetical protein
VEREVNSHPAEQGYVSFRRQRPDWGQQTKDGSNAIDCAK